VFVTFVPSPAGTVAVMVTAPEVGPLQVAVPKVGPCTLLMLTLMLSETDQVPFVRLLWDTTHPEVTAEAKTSKCRVFPGGGAVWLMVALAGENVDCSDLAGKRYWAGPTTSHGGERKQA